MVVIPLAWRSEQWIFCVSGIYNLSGITFPSNTVVLIMETRPAAKEKEDERRGEEGRDEYKVYRTP
jgi:hypothetical protein